MDARKARSRSPRRTESFSPFSSLTLSKFLLFQAKSHSPYFQSLSFNVVREICSYLGFSTCFAMLNDYRVSVFDLGALRWKQLSPRLSPASVWSYGFNLVLLSPSQVFLCGGHIIGNFQVAVNEAITVSNWGVVELPPMRTARKDHGLVYDEIHGVVCVFGGFTSYRQALRTAERFDLAKKEWRSLAYMTRITGKVHTCRHQTKVYLISESGEIEVLDLLSYALFTSKLTINPINSAKYFTFQGLLCGISNKTLIKYNIADGKMVQLVQIDMHNDKPYMVYADENQVYCLADNFKVHCVNLRSGEAHTRVDIRHK